MEIKEGTTNVTIPLKLRLKSNGQVATGFVYNSPGISCYYVRGRGASVQIPLVELDTPQQDDDHLDGGFIEKDNMGGSYRLDILDAVCVPGLADGEKFATIHIEMTNVFAEEIRIDLTIDKLQYVGGVWIDSGAANTDTVVGVDGTPSNPVSTFVAARTLADALGFQKYYLTNGSGLTLAATHQWWEFVGKGRAGNIINLGGQDVDNSSFVNVSLAGTQGGSTFIKMEDCLLTSLVALRPQAYRCGIAGSITILSGTMLLFDQCYSCVPGESTPELTFSAGVTGLNIRHNSGGWLFKSMTSDHTLSLENIGQAIFHATCSGGSASLRGLMSLTDNSGNVTITKDAVYNQQQISDSMKLAPTAGAPASGSVNQHLDLIISDLARVLGLSYENAYQHTRNYSGGKLQNAKLDLYDSKTNAQTHDGSTGIVAKYTLTFTYDENNLASMQVVRDS